MLAKHSIRIKERNINIRLEQEFWNYLRDIAAERDITLSALVKEVIGELGSESDGRAIASTLRVYVLDEVMRAARVSSEVGEQRRRRRVVPSIPSNRRQ
jgi:predicted DNA-binding ribbon-helix-helix protein